MTELRQKMIRVMGLKNLSDNTQRRYLAAVTGLSQHYNQSPENIKKEMIEDYLLYLKNEKGHSPNSCGSELSGLRFFYRNVLEEEILIDFNVRRRTQKLPTVLTKEQIWDIISSPKNVKHRLMLMTTYSAGLRASEVIALKPEHIESNRMLIKIVDGKGNKDRYTLLSVKLLKELRDYYKEYQPQSYLFPSSFSKKKRSRYATKPLGIFTKRLERQPGLKMEKVFTH